MVRERAADIDEKGVKVLTCWRGLSRTTDLSTIPLEILPVQATLHFSHLPSQGDPAVDAFLQDIFSTSTSDLRVAQPATCSGTLALAHGSPDIDLRKCLMTLQTGGSASFPPLAPESAIPAEGAHYPHPLRMLHAARVMDSLSWIDAELATAPLREMDVGVLIDLLLPFSS